MASYRQKDRRKLTLVLGESAILFCLVFTITSFTAALHFVKLGQFAISPDDLVRAIVKAALIVATCQICYFFTDLYDWRVLANTNQTSILLLQSVAHTGILLAIFFYLLKGADELFGGTGRAEAYAAHPVFTAVSLALIYPISYYYRITFRWTVSSWGLKDRLMFVGASPMSETLEREILERADPGYEVVGYILEDLEKSSCVPEGRTVLGDFSRIFELCKQEKVSHIIVTLPERRGKLPILELLNCRLAGIRIEEGELFYERLTGKIAIEKLRPSYLIFSEGFYRSKFNYIFKRFIDVAVASTGLVFSFPLAILAAIMIRLESPGPILFRQQRVGKEGKVFTLYKFRSMRADAESKTGPVWAQQGDARITRVGNFIRKTRIDEIPQMFNVLKNEMSFVGPRPERPFFVEELKKEIPYYTERLVVKPGITGWAQINHSYGNSKDDAIAKLQYDLYYIKNMTIFLDIIIILRTIKVIVLRKGAV